jgi:hypothetical protein
MFSNTFAGIAPSSAPTFIAAQVVGGILAFGLVRLLYPGMTPAEAADVTVPHDHLSSAGRPRGNAASHGTAPSVGRSSGPPHG